MELKGTTALVTGGGIRLGRAVVLMLAKHGCNIALHYHASEEDAREVARQAEEFGVKVRLYQADLDDLDALEMFVERVASDFGHFDILVNNAGTYMKGKGLDTTAELLRAQFNINLFAPLLLTRAFARQLPEDRQGKVINISDSKVFRNAYDHFAYRLTKAGVNEMTAMFALELAPRITVNAIAPGIMLPLAGFEHIDMEAVGERRVPLKRVGSPEIIAENVLHILTQDFMTGHVLRVDGGEYL